MGSNSRDAPLPPGKLPADLLRELLDEKLPPEVRVPPALGEDACVIALEGGALIAATDPITLTGSGVGAHAVIINANDVAAMGVRPRWFLATLLLPVGTTEAAVREIFADMRSALADLDASLVGGHSEVTDAVRQPVVVGQMLGLAEDGRFVATGGASPGDVILQIGRAPVEGAAVLAVEAEDALRELAPEILDRARKALRDPGISVVAPALRAAGLGATALHDPTEGGLSAGLHELAEASGVALRGLARDTVLWFEPGLAICQALGADPWGTLASGALLAAFASDLADGARSVLAAEGYEVAEIARVCEGRGVWLESGAELTRYERDELSRVLAELAQPGEKA